MFRSCQWEKLQKGLPVNAALCWMTVGCGLYQIDYTQDFSGTLVGPALVQHLESVHEFFQQNGFAFPENGGCILEQYKKRWRPCFHLHPNTKRTHLFNQTLQQSRVPVWGGRRAGTLWGALGALYRQHQQASTPDYASSRRAKKGMHPGRDFACTPAIRRIFPKLWRKSWLRRPWSWWTPKRACLLSSPPQSNGKTSLSIWTDACCWDTAHKGRYISQNQQSAGDARETDVLGLVVYILLFL